MYPPAHFQENDYGKQIAFVKQHNFAAITAFVNGQYHVAHIPIIVKEENGKHVLYGHFASDNPIVAAAQNGTELSFVFNGPHCFVSSTWYDAMQASTWNYTMVHIQAKPVVLPATALPGLLDDLIAQEEHDNPSAPRYANLPEKYTRGLLPYITPVQFNIVSIRGVFKLSQNRSANHRQLIITQLQKRGDYNSLAIAGLMDAE